MREKHVNVELKKGRLVKRRSGPSNLGGEKAEGEDPGGRHG